MCSEQAGKRQSTGPQKQSKGPDRATHACCSGMLVLQMHRDTDLLGCKTDCLTPQRQTRQAGRQADRQTDRQTGR